MATSPYQRLPRHRYWSSAVKGRDLGSLSGLYQKRFPIAGLRIATAGSCFAQHIASHLREAGYEVVDKEPPPPGLRGEKAKKFGYLTYSARHGNIYTSRQLLQLAQESFGLAAPSDVVWERDGRYVDALRPAVEPGGLERPEEVLEQRADHLVRVREVLTSCDLFIFTLGLTELWLNRADGTAYPVAPGVVAGHYDAQRHGFLNLTFHEIYEDLVRFRELVKTVNPGLKLLLTVSPVPLAATAEARHVLMATVQSKSVLRAVVSQLYDDFDDIDYFPSFEALSTPFLGPCGFEDDMRSVRPDAVRGVMEIFIAEHGQNIAARDPARRGRAPGVEEVACEEALLDAFAQAD